MRTELPKEWYIKVTEDNREMLSNWKKTTQWKDGAKAYDYIFADGCGINNITPSIKRATEITTEEFKNLVFKKKLIGYKLIKPKFFKAACAIAHSNLNPSDINGYGVTSEYSINKLKEVNVLDLWFEPVYEDTKPELIAGKWYKAICLSGIEIFALLNDDKTLFNKGFYNNVWDTNPNGIVYVNRCTNITLATDDEIKEALFKEAERRGFKKGIKFKNIGSWNKNSTVVFDGTLNYSTSYYSKTTLYLNGCDCSKVIFCDGQWAEIIKHSLPKIGGYQGEFKNGQIYYGCKSVTPEFIDELIQLGTDYIQLNECAVKREELIQIKEYIDSQK